MNVSALAPGIPPLTNIYLYTTDECNLACKHCWVMPRRHGQALRPSVSVALLRRVIEQALPLGLQFVKISGGEALLRRDDILELLELLDGLDLDVRLETNGTLVDEEVADVLQRTGTPVSISLDGATAEVHEDVRRVDGCFEETLRALGLLRDRGVPVELVFSMHRHNRPDLDGVLRIAETLPDSWVKINPIIASGRAVKMMQRGELLSAVELAELVEELEQREDELPVPVMVNAEPVFYSLRSIHNRRPGGGRCGFRHLLGILADGSVSFCGMGYKYSQYVFGRAEDVDLPELWNHHPVLAEVRSCIPESLEGVCGNCVFKWDCQGGCRSNAFDHQGSITAPTRNCQGLYEAGRFPRSRMIDPDLATPYPVGDGAAVAAGARERWTEA